MLKNINMKCTAIVLAGGSGKRMHSDVKKQFIEINDRPLIYYALKAFEESIVDNIILVTSKDDIEYVKNEIVSKYFFTKVSKIVSGGKERYDSVYNGIMAADDDTDIVLIHDGARPFVTEKIIESSIEVAKESKAAVVGMPVKDTMKIIDENGFAASTPDRKKMWMIQTPQTFDYKLIKEAYQKMQAEKDVLIAHGLNITDDSMVVETFSDTKVKIIEGSYENIKITTPSDIALANAILENTF